ncbi:MAG: FAD-dependent oxidoreductase [Propionibacteriaceae bacterium]
MVVGGGLSGLAAAAELADQAQVCLVERLPAPGGVWEFEHPIVRELMARCESAGVEVLLGCSALRWSGNRLLVLGPGRVEWLEADHLVFAGGSRPATAAELGVAGGRLAGVFAATVAHHLLEAGVRLGRRPVVVGTASEAALVIPHLLKHGGATVVGGCPPNGVTGTPLGSHAIDWWPGYRPLRFTGADRVAMVQVGDGRAEFELPCDSVVLAASPKPLRNIDGAVRDASSGVTFIQPLDPAATAAEVVLTARNAISSLPSTIPSLQGIS